VTAAEVGDRIRDARLAKDWTQAELAARMGVNERTVSRWQSGHLPKPETLVQLAVVLGVPQAYFVATEDVAAALGDLQERVGQLTTRVESLTRALEWLETPAGDRS
jgi:transcriptional regulator with XRE-family HTH domain